MAELNDLFEEAASLSLDFAAEVTSAVEAVTEMRANADKVQQKAEAETAEVKKAIDALESFMDTADDELEQARERAETGLDALMTKATAVKGEIDGLVAAVKKGASELETKKKELQDAVTAQMETAAEDFQGRAQQAQDVTAAAQQGLKDAQTALNGFRQTVEQARTELDDKMSKWQQAVDDLTGAAAKEADDWVDGLQALLETSVAALFTGANETVAAHNQAMADLKTAFVEDAPEKLDASVVPLLDQFATLMDLVETRKTELPAKATEIANRIQALLGDIETARTALDATDRL
jgi:chromosome segregation ATPase